MLPPQLTPKVLQHLREVLRIDVKPDIVERGGGDLVGLLPVYFKDLVYRLASYILAEADDDDVLR